MNIGRAADATGVSAKQIRYYEKIGLINGVDRSNAGYRRYDSRDLHTLRFIRRARQLGFSIAEIKTLLALWQDRDRSRADVRKIAQAHVVDMQNRISQLQSMVETLQELVTYCRRGNRPDCPILAELQGDDR